MNAKIYLSAFVLGLFALSACDEKNPPEPVEATPLAAPVPSVTASTIDGFTVEWKAVENAAAYTYVLNDGAEATIQALSVSFIQLAPGTHSFKVKAVAGSEEYADSDYATLSYTLEDPTEGFNMVLEAVNVTAASVTLNATPSDNSIPYFFDLISAEFYNLYSNPLVFISDYVEYLRETYGYSTVADLLNAISTTGADSKFYEGVDITPDTEWVAVAFTTVNGSIGSHIYTDTFRTQEKTASLTDWCAPWEAHSTQILRLTGAGQGTMLDEATDFSINIEKYPGSELEGMDAVLIYGLSNTIEGREALALMDGDGNLWIQDDITVSIGDLEEPGYTARWGGICYYEGSYTKVQDLTYLYKISMAEDGTATFTPISGTTYSGGDFELVAIDILAVNQEESSNWGFYVDSYPVELKSGSITMKKSI